jgi:hypothetical protein
MEQSDPARLARPQADQSVTFDEAEEPAERRRRKTANQ